MLIAKYKVIYTSCIEYFVEGPETLVLAIGFTSFSHTQFLPLNSPLFSLTQYPPSHFTQFSLFSLTNIPPPPSLNSPFPLHSIPLLFLTQYPPSLNSPFPLTQFPSFPSLYSPLPLYSILLSFHHSIPLSPFTQFPHSISPLPLTKFFLFSFFLTLSTNKLFLVMFSIVGNLHQILQVENPISEFALCVIYDTGYQEYLADEEYPLMRRLKLGPSEDISKIFIVEADTGEKKDVLSEEVRMSYTSHVDHVIWHVLIMSLYISCVCHMLIMWCHTC